MVMDRDRTREVAVAAGDVFYFDGTDMVRVPLGGVGEVLVVNGAGTAPEWGQSTGPQVDIETGSVQSDGSVEFRWGIDSSGRPYFDSTGAVVAAEIARLFFDTSDGRFKAADLGGI